MFKRLFAVMATSMIAAVALVASMAPVPEPAQAGPIVSVENYDWVPEYFCNPATGEEGLFPYDEVNHHYLSPTGWSGPYTSATACMPTSTATPTATATIVLTPTSTPTSASTPGTTPTATSTVGSPSPSSTPGPTSAPTSNTVPWSAGPDNREAVCVVHGDRVDKEMWLSSRADMVPYGNTNNGITAYRMPTGKDCGVTLPDSPTPVRRALILPPATPTIYVPAMPEVPPTPDVVVTMAPTSTPAEEATPDVPVMPPNTGDGSLATDVEP